MVKSSNQGYMRDGLHISIQLFCGLKLVRFNLFHISFQCVSPQLRFFVVVAVINCAQISVHIELQASEKKLLTV